MGTERAQRVDNIEERTLFWKRGSNTPAKYIYQLRSRTSPIEGYTHCSAKYVLAQHIFTNRVNHMFNDQGKRLSTDTLLYGNHGKPK